jgi:hypothetical protein
LTRFGEAVLTITDDKKLQFWNLSKSTPDVDDAPTLPSRMTAPLLPLRVNSELTLDLSDSDSCRALTVCRGGRWIGLASKHHESVQIYDLQTDVPRLSDLCRIAVRRSVAFRRFDGGGLDSLPVPEVLKKFLHFDSEWLKGHFQIGHEC